MSNEHPFQVLFETLGRVPSSHTESVNRQAYQMLSGILTVPVEKTGHCILLRAPRAGHGKTHLLSRIQHELGATHEFIPLHPVLGYRIDAASVTDDTLRRLVRQLPAAGGLTVLDLVTRRLFSSALQPLVASGEVPCQDREGALAALRTRPMETFDFHHPNAVTAHWARENFEILGQRLSLELAQRCNLPVGGISFWVDAMFQFASAPLENAHRGSLLAESVRTSRGMEMERLEALLGLLSLLMRVVLVADDLEGFSTDETAALRLAAFLGTLRQSVERLDVILSLNQDIWQSAFLPRLSGGLADRLSEVIVELEPLTEGEMEALLDSRVPGLGRRVLDRIDVKSAGTHARGLIRAAGIAWIKATAMDSAAASSAPPQTAPVAVPSVPAMADQETVSGMDRAPAQAVESAIMESSPHREATTPEPPPYHSSVDSPFQFATAPPQEPSSSPNVSPSSPNPEISSEWRDPYLANRTVEVQGTSNVYQPDFQPPGTQNLGGNPPMSQAVESDNFVVGGSSEEFAVTGGSIPPETATSNFDSPPPMVPETNPQPPSDPYPAFADAPPPAATGDTDRVDHLLRQFRERYGRGSL